MSQIFVLASLLPMSASVQQSFRPTVCSELTAARRQWRRERIALLGCHAIQIQNCNCAELNSQYDAARETTKGKKIEDPGRPFNHSRLIFFKEEVIEPLSGLLQSSRSYLLMYFGG